MAGLGCSVAVAVAVAVAGSRAVGWSGVGDSVPPLVTLGQTSTSPRPQASLMGSWGPLQAGASSHGFYQLHNQELLEAVSRKLQSPRRGGNGARRSWEEVFPRSPSGLWDGQASRIPHQYSFYSSSRLGSDWWSGQLRAQQESRKPGHSPRESLPSRTDETPTVQYARRTESGPCGSAPVLWPSKAA